MRSPILHVRPPNFPQLRFEWHPVTRKVYVVRVPADPEIGEIVAVDIDDQGSATNAILIWLRGYRTRMAELAGAPPLRTSPPPPRAGDEGE